MVIDNNSLLASDEPDAFEIIEGDEPIIVICDHASKQIPIALGDMGLDRRHLEDHIAWDIGAGGVARYLARRFRATALLANYSRLVVDLNRSLQDASVFPAISDGVLVPANLSLARQARDLRADALFHPYHDAIDKLIAMHTSVERRPILLAVHSFTPQFHGTKRPWDIGILWDRDPRLALPLLAELRTEPGVNVGDNEPYSGRHTADYSIDTHAEPHHIAHVGLEFRQDLITDAAGQQRWAEILAGALEAVLASRGAELQQAVPVGG